MGAPPLDPGEPTAPILPPPPRDVGWWLRPQVTASIIAVLVLALLATTTVAVVQARAAAEARAEARELAQQVEQLRDEVAELERELEAAQRSPLDRFRGPDGFDPRELFEGLLDDLFGDLLDERSGGGAGEGFGDLFDGLLDGFLGRATQGIGGQPGAACLRDTVAAPPDPLGDLLGGLTGRGSASGGTTDDLVGSVERIGEQVSTIRELEWQTPVTATALDDQAIRDRIRQLTTPDPEALRRLAVTERTLIDLGALPPGSDLLALQTALLEESVAGFYVPETEELVVRAPEGVPLDPGAEVVLAHELEHALVDQVLGLPDLSGPPWQDTGGSGPYRDDRDGALAALAVIEGDATLTMHLWALTQLGVADQLGVALDPDLVAAQRALGGLPPVLVAELLFPYTDGLEWVCQRWLEGGWSAVDAAYTEPPTTTSEVLTGLPVEPVRPPQAIAPPGFEVAAVDTFGAAELLWHLEAPGGERTAAVDRPRERVRAWAGGTVTSLGNGEDHATVLTLIDGEVVGVPALCDSVLAFVAAAQPSATTTTDAGLTTVAGDRATAVQCDGEVVRLAVAPRLGTARTLVGG